MYLIHICKPYKRHQCSTAVILPGKTSAVSADGNSCELGKHYVFMCACLCVVKTYKMAMTVCGRLQSTAGRLALLTLSTRWQETSSFCRRRSQHTGSLLFCTTVFYLASRMYLTHEKCRLPHHKGCVVRHNEFTQRNST